MEANLSAESLQAARAAAGLTMEEVAAQLGVTRQAVGHWEAGSATPGGPARRVLAQIFGVTLDTVDSWFDRERATA